MFVVSNMKVKACLLESFEVNDKILITPDSSWVELVSKKHTGDEPRAPFVWVIFFMLQNKHVIHVKTKRDKLDIEFMFES